MATTKREAIRNAALTLFAENGVDATTIREIAHRAETAEGNLYRHFKNKEDLVRQLFAQSAELFGGTLGQSAKDIPDPQQRLASLVRGIFDFADQEPSAFKYLLSVHHTGILKDREKMVRPVPMQLFVETIQDGMSSGLFRSVHPMMTAGWIIAMAQRAVVMMSADIITNEREEVIAQTADAAFRLVKAE